MTPLVSSASPLPLSGSGASALVSVVAMAARVVVVQALTGLLCAMRGEGGEGGADGVGGGAGFGMTIASYTARLVALMTEDDEKIQPHIAPNARQPQNYQ